MASNRINSRPEVGRWFGRYWREHGRKPTFYRVWRRCGAIEKEAQAAYRKDPKGYYTSVKQERLWALHKTFKEVLDSWQGRLDSGQLSLKG